MKICLSYKLKLKEEMLKWITNTEALRAINPLVGKHLYIWKFNYWQMYQNILQKENYSSCCNNVFKSCLLYCSCVKMSLFVEKGLHLSELNILCLYSSTLLHYKVRSRSQKNAVRKRHKVALLRHTFVTKKRVSTL